MAQCDDGKEILQKRKEREKEKVDEGECWQGGMDGTREKEIVKKVEILGVRENVKD